MAISKLSSAPLVVVVGITGNQGGSVARALIESDKPYRIRGLTRDVTRPAAQTFGQQGVELVGVSLTVDNANNVLKAFDGADIVFIVTNFHEHKDGEREIAEGKLLVDTAKAVGVTLLIWSALESLTSLSGGKLSHVKFFDSKAEITAYAKQSGVPLSVVQAGYYATNIFDASYAFKQQSDGSYLFCLPVPSSTMVPLIDVEHDYGTYVRAAIESPTLGAGSEVLSGRLISLGDIIAQLAEISGKKIAYSQIDREAFIEAIPLKALGPMFADMYQAYADVGYYGPKKLTSEDLLAKRPRSWLDVLKVTPRDRFPV